MAMDPFSITIGCISLITAVVEASSVVNRFSKTYRETRSDLTALSNQLDELQRILDLVRHDDTPGEPATQLAFEKSQEHVNRCFDVLATLQKVLEEYEEPLARFQWAWKGKKKVDAIRLEISNVIDHFNLTLGIYDSSLTRDIKYDTSAILDGQADVLARLDALHEELVLSTPRRNTFRETMSASPPKYAANRRGKAASPSIRDVFWRPDEEGWDCSYTSASSVAGSEDGERDFSSADYGSQVLPTADSVNSESNEVLHYAEACRSDGRFALFKGSPEQYRTESRIQLASASSVKVLREQCYASQTLHCATKRNTGEPASLRAEYEARDKIRASFKETVWASAGESSPARRRLKRPVSTQANRAWITKTERDEKAVKIRARFKEMVQAKVKPPE